MQQRFPKVGNYVDELRWPQDENGYDKEAFRIKCFRSYSEYLDDEDPLFYFENADSIVAPAFYATFKEQEIDKLPKYTQVKDFDEMVSEDTMKEAFCLWDGNFEPWEEDYLSPIFPEFMDSAMFTNGRVIKKCDLAMPDTTDIIFLDSKLKHFKIAQNHSRQSNFETYSKTFTVKDLDTNEEFERLSDKAMTKSELNQETFRIMAVKRKIPVKTALKRYDEKSIFRSYSQCRYIKVSPDEFYDVDVDKEENCSFFQLVLNAFYFEQENALIYKEGFGTLPISQTRSLKDLKYRKKKGWSFVKTEYEFLPFIKRKYSLLVKSFVQKKKYAYVLFDFSYISSAAKIIFIRILTALATFPHDLTLRIFSIIWWFVEEMQTTEKEVIENDNNTFKKLIQKLRAPFIRIVSKRIEPPKNIKQFIKLKFNKMKKSIKERYFNKKKKK